MSAKRIGYRKRGSFVEGRSGELHCRVEQMICSFFSFFLFSSVFNDVCLERWEDCSVRLIVPLRECKLGLQSVALGFSP